MTAAAAIAATGALTACGAPASVTGASGSVVTSAAPAVSLATSLSTAADSWAVLPVSARPAFWEVLVRPAGSAAWRLVTPPGVADNGGLVAAATGSSLTVAVRPSQDLLFSPLAATVNGGGSWSTEGPLGAGVAYSPGALAAAGRELLAVLGDGAIVASSDAGDSWRTLARPGAIGGTAPGGGECGPVGVSTVSFLMNGTGVVAGGSCAATGTTGIFTRSSLAAGGGWRRVGLPVSGPLVRLLAGGTLLVRAQAGLTAVWAEGWHAYAPLNPSTKPAGAGSAVSAPLPGSASVTASGALAGGGAWVLLAGGRAATIGGPGRPWVVLPLVPATTSVLAAGPGGAVDALAVAGAKVTVWRLGRAAAGVARAGVGWRKIQTITVPVQYGSSS